MNNPVIFVDFVDVNKPHRKKVYQSTNNYDKLFNILAEFQMKLGSTSLEVKTHENLKSTKHVYVYLCISQIF